MYVYVYIHIVCMYVCMYVLQYTHAYDLLQILTMSDRRLMDALVRSLAC